MRDKLIELMNNAMLTRENDRLMYGEARLTFEELADYLIAHGVTLATDNNVGDKKPLTIAERADLNRIQIDIERKCRAIAQPGVWERYTKHMECGEVRALTQYYRDMGLVYKLITGCELPEVPKEVE